MGTSHLEAGNSGGGLAGRVLIPEAVEGDEKGFHMAGGQETKEGRRHADQDKLPDPAEFWTNDFYDDDVEAQPEKRAESIHAAPSGQKKITRFTLIGVTAFRAAVERLEPIKKGAGFGQGWKNRVLTAQGTLERESVPQVRHGFADGIIRAGRGYLV